MGLKDENLNAMRTDDLLDDLISLEANDASVQGLEVQLAEDAVVPHFDPLM